MRRKNHDGNDLIRFSNMDINLKNREVFIGNQKIKVNRKEFDVLYYLVLNKFRLVTKCALAENVWGDNIDQMDDYEFVYYQIKNIRKKILAADANFEISSVYGIGYKLINK